MSKEKLPEDLTATILAAAKARGLNAKVTTGAQKKADTKELLKKRAAERAKNPEKGTYTPDTKYSLTHGLGKDPISGRSYSESVELEEGAMKAAAKDTSDDEYEATLHHAVKMAKGVAFDKRYKAGNMTGAVRAIGAIGKKFGIGNLHNHPEVKNALQRANEEVEQVNEMDKSQPSSSRGAEGLATGSKATPVKTAEVMKDALKVLIKSRKNVKEEVEYIEEKLTAADPASKWIGDFVKSDNPKFAGKSRKERMNMALGAYYGAKRGK